MKFDFAVIGGDFRSVQLAKKLSDLNFKVIGLNLSSNDSKIEVSNSVQQVVKMSKNLICPLPLTRDGNSIVSDNFSEELTIKNLLENVTESNVIFAGNIPSKVASFLNGRRIQFYDFMEDEVFSKLNAVLTAETVVAQAILDSPVAMHFSSSLVLGFGRCGKVIANKLKGLCCKTAVAARKNEDLALAESFGFAGIKIENLSEKIGEFNFIFNTIPAEILNEDVLKNVSKDAIILSIANFNGNLEEIEKFNVKFKVSLQIPGRFKFDSAANILLNFILKELKSSIG